MSFRIHWSSVNGGENPARLLLQRMQTIESLALFPLSDVVLLPDISIPLRLFEPRYLQMAHDVMAGTNQIGMVAVRPDSLVDIAGDPPIFAVGCVGQISHTQRQPDGTIQILLVGMRRFRILQEEERSGDRLYRCARVELLTDESPTSAEELERLEGYREDLLALLERLVRRLGSAGAGDHASRGFERLEPSHLINSLTQSIAIRPVERQQLLEADAIIGRFEIMCDLLRFRLAETGGVETGTTGLPN